MKTSELIQSITDRARSAKFGQSINHFHDDRDAGSQIVPSIDAAFDGIQAVLPMLDDATILHLLQRMRRLIPWIDCEYARRVSAANAAF